jgi:Immunity protein Imm1
MIDIAVRIHGNVATRVSTADELDRMIAMAAEEAQARGKLNIIFLDAPDGNELSLVVGGDETVLGFVHGHRDPPYYATRGATADLHPVMTCYVGLAHHTEFPRRHVISYAEGLAAAREFAVTGSLPRSVEWITV